MIYTIRRSNLLGTIPISHVPDNQPVSVESPHTVQFRRVNFSRESCDIEASLLRVLIFPRLCPLVATRSWRYKIRPAVESSIGAYCVWRLYLEDIQFDGLEGGRKDNVFMVRVRTEGLRWAIGGMAYYSRLW